MLEKQGLECWVAPRDIKYGSGWAESIADGLFQQTKLFVFFLSKNGNKSRQVLKEINLAIELDIPILVFCTIQHNELNKALRYYLGDIHINYCESFSDFNYQTILDDIIHMYHGVEKQPEKKNIDEELNNAFHEFFDTNHDAEPEDAIKSEEASVNQLLYDILWRNINEHSAWDENVEEELDESELEDDFLNLDNMEFLEGMSFSITESSDVEQYGYEVLFEIQEDTLKKVPYLEPLDYIQKKSKIRNVVKRTFFVDFPRKIGNILLIVTNINDYQISYLNCGFLDREEVHWFKSCVCEWNYTKDEKKKEYTANEKSDIILIDPTNPQPIKRHRKYNHATGNYETIIDLYDTRSYVAFKFDDFTASPFEMGYAYYFGDFGLEKNNMKAARWFMQSDEPWAYFYLGQIFELDPLLKDTEMSKHYFDLAEKNGVIENHHAYIQ